MDNRTLALECVRLAGTLVSPSVNDRVEGIAQISTQLYSHIVTLSSDKVAEDVPADKLARRPRKPRELQDNATPLDEDKSRNVTA